MSKQQYENAVFYQVRYTEDGNVRHYEPSEINRVNDFLNKGKTDKNWIVEKITVKVERLS